MFRAMVTAGTCIAAVVTTFFGSPVVAADLSVPPTVAPAGVQSYCGPCGCLQVTHVYHRSMESTYGLNFDPRNDDQTVPHYYFGRVRAYPRYVVDGVPAPGSC
jgi:hypothetical protein